MVDDRHIEHDIALIRPGSRRIPGTPPYYSRENQVRIV
jgi:hypothetical protein